MSNGRCSPRIWSELGEFEQRLNWQRILFWFGLVTGFFTVIIGVDLFILTKLRLFDGFVPSEDALTGYRYLLSATAQVLAALFALVFSITLIVTQLATKYTQRAVGIVFDKRINFYIGGFALAVIFPLMWIITPMWVGAIESVVIGALYVLSLPPFFLYFIRKMKIDAVIAELKRLAIEATNAGKEERTRVMINALDNIAMGAFTDRNFEVFELAVAALTDLTLEVNQEQLLDLRDKLKDTCQELIDNPRAPIIIIENLGKAGASAIEERLKSPDAPKNILREDYAIEIIMNVANLRKKETPDRLLYFCVAALADMTEAARRYKDKDIEGELEVKIKGVFTYFTDRESPEGWYNKAKERVRPLGITP